MTHFAFSNAKSLHAFSTTWQWPHNKDITEKPYFHDEGITDKPNTRNTASYHRNVTIIAVITREAQQNCGEKNQRGWQRGAATNGRAGFIFRGRPVKLEQTCRRAQAKLRIKSWIDATKLKEFFTEQTIFYDIRRILLAISLETTISRHARTKARTQTIVSWLPSELS